MRKINIYLPADIHAVVKEQAQDTKKRMSEIIRQHLLEYVSDPAAVYTKHKRSKDKPMVRTNVFLQPEQFELISNLAAGAGCCKADVIRSALEARVDLGPSSAE